MKKNLKFKWTLILGLIVTTAFVGCNKTENTFDDMNIKSLDLALDEAFAAELFDEIIEISDEAVNFNFSDLKTTDMFGYRFMRMGDCVTVSTVTTDGSTVITIDFGEEGCTGQDGRERKGVMIMTKTGNYFEGQTMVTYEFENYFVNGNQVTGVKTVNGYINDNGNRQMDIVDNGAIILADNGGTISRTAQRTREVIEGSDTRDKHDDIISVTGISTGISADGETFSSEITSPLIRNNTNDCSRFYVSGIIHIIKGDGTEIFIDFGDGSCDNLAEVTTNGETEIIELKGDRKRF